MSSRPSDDAAARVTLRPAGPGDATELSGLLAELGYPSSPEAVTRRIAACAVLPGVKVVVAAMDGRLAGVVSVHCVPSLVLDAALGRITALVVAAAARGCGIGRLLVEAAEAFAREQGCERIELTSGDHRPDAHAFYERLGYVVECRRFIKHVPGLEG
jgi:GNAT superfamily N-acetyltransferase